MTCCLVMPPATAAPAVGAAVAAGAVLSDSRPAFTASMSALMIRPCGPEPGTAPTSMPASFASRRASGEAKTRPLAPFASGNSSVLPEASAGGMARRSTGGATGAKAPSPFPPGRGDAAAGAASFTSPPGGEVGAVAPGEGAFAAGAGAFTSAALSPSCSSTAMTELTFTLSVPSGTTILPILPSSTASTSIVALSVSISAMTSPEETLSPSLTCHLASLPSSIVGESAGMVILMLILASFTDIFVPERRVLRDEVRHHVGAALFANILDLDAGEGHHILEAFEILRFCHDDARDTELDDGAGAHHAGRKRRVAGDVLIGSLPAGVLDCVHLAMQDRIALLHPPVMAPPDDLAIPDQHRADRNATFRQPLLGFVVGSVQELLIELVLGWHR